VSGEAHVPTIHHDLRTIIAELTQKIAYLEAAKETVMDKLKSGREPDMNSDALDEICESLEAAKNGKTLLMNSCCNGQNCDIEYYD
jgi:DNA-binding Xre family transcriptional regulator